VPPQLFDQVRDGVADVVWTLPGYTPGRFPIMSVFELPFMVSDAAATSKAAHAFYEAHAREEFADVHPILFHVHDRGVIHSRGVRIETMDDMAGVKLRAPGRAIGDALEAYGAAPVFLPVPQVPEALSRGVIDGTVVPWEVTVPLRLYEIADHHTEIPGDRGLYTAVFLFAMNKATYEGLPGDLKSVIDANSGQAIAGWVGEAWVRAEEPGRRLARERGNTIVAMAEDEVARLRERALGVRAAWVAELTAAGHDGAALLAAAEALIDEHGKAGD
jgi:TRAP-type transport system periplasmic protein